MVLQKTGVILVFGLLMAMSAPLIAQEAQTTAPQQPQTVERQKVRRAIKRRRHVKRFGFGLRRLDLTAEQRLQTQAILQRHLESIRGQREELLRLREKRISGTLTDDDRARAKALHQELRDARQGIRGDLSNLLTTEQRTQLEQMKSQRKTRREERLKRRQELRERLPQ
jgi:Spy/CpxP family protein refolding chaperone